MSQSPGRKFEGWLFAAARTTSSSTPAVAPILNYERSVYHDPANHALLPSRARRSATSARGSSVALAGLMVKTIRELGSRHPFLAGLLASFIWICFWFSEFYHLNGVLSALVPAGFIVGAFIGANRIERWPDILKAFPSALLGLVINSLVFMVVRSCLQEAPNDFTLVDTSLYGTAFAAFACSPILLIGELIGWRASRVLKS